MLVSAATVAVMRREGCGKEVRKGGEGRRRAGGGAESGPEEEAARKRCEGDMTEETAGGRLKRGKKERRKE